MRLSIINTQKSTMQSQQNSAFQAKQKHHFARLFPELESLYVPDEALEELANSMKEYKRQAAKNNSIVISNGIGIFSQFLAHDITFESSSKLKGQFNQSSQFQNDRTINLDLDCVYGQRTQAFFYDVKDSAKLLLGKEYKKGRNTWHDLQRNAQGKAIIPDARNDENIIVSRMQVLFIKFHNKMVDHLRKKKYKGNLFNEAKRLVIWYYHWLIINEYLYKIMDWEVFERIKREGCQYFTQPHTMPLEFTGAAFRVGHSQTRETNRINAKTEKSLLELGSFKTMEEYVDWHYIFNFGDDKCQFAKLIDTKIGKSFHDIKFIPAKRKIDRSLPFLNLRRGVVYGLPSGESVANRLGFEPIEVKETEDLKLSGTPLWFYILREAELQGHKGEHLGPVGSTILGECFFSIMREDDFSFLKLHPKWKPTLGKDIGEFEFTDLIRFVYK